MIQYRPLTAKAIKSYRDRDIYDIPGEFDLNDVVIGYNVYICGLLEGFIMIADRGDYYTLDGYNSGSISGFIKAMRKILSDYDSLEEKKVLQIIRDIKRPDLTSIYKRFGFEYMQQVSIWHIYRRIHGKESKR